MTQEQLDLLRSVAEQDKDNCVSIAILKLLDMVEEQKAKLDAVVSAADRSCCHCDTEIDVEMMTCCEWKCEVCGQFNSHIDTINAMVEATGGYP